MTERTPPYFPAPAPEAFADPRAVRDWCSGTFADLATVCRHAATADPGLPTPCSGFRLDDLLGHVLGWADFFGHAFVDPTGLSQRPDPAAYRLDGESRAPAEVVADAAARIDAALAGGVLDARILLSQAEMDGPAATAMVLGEYLVHGWDLARASGQQWAPDAGACEGSLAFFAGIITPDYRGPEGFFGDEVPVPHDAPALDRLIGFAGRDPGWSAGSR